MAKGSKYDDMYADPEETIRLRTESMASAAINPPNGMQRFSIEQDGTYEFDIIPYIVGKGNIIPPGKLYWERTYKVHQKVGIDEKNIACLRQFGEACPVCEMFNEKKAKVERGDQAGWDAASAFKAKDRQLMLWRPKLRNSEPKVMYFEDSYHAFGKVLIQKLELGNERNGYRRFWMLRGGLSVQAVFKTQTSPKGSWRPCTTIELIPREKDIPDSVVDELPKGVLDNMLVKLSYKKVEAILHGDQDDAPEEDDDHGRNLVTAQTGRNTRDDDDPQPKRRETKPKDDDDDPPPRKRKEEPETKKVKELDVGDYVKHPRLGRCKVVKKSGDGSLLQLADEDNDIHSKIPVEDVTLGIPADEPPPGKRGGAPAEPDEDDGKGWRRADDDDDDPPVKKPRGRGR